jgi:ABC-2 type transport system permease protein
MLTAIRPIWLIAEREFRAYAATVSFWIALLVGPLALGLFLMVGQAGDKPVKPAAVYVSVADPALMTAAVKAVKTAAAADGRKIRVVDEPSAPTRVRVERQGEAIVVRLSGTPVLTGAGRRLAGEVLANDRAVELLSAAGLPAPSVKVTVDAAPAKPAMDPQRAGRFAVVMMLWMTRTGSLGMLLQAVVRERANRALESLLAAAAPWQIVAGKLLGVGGVSALVLTVWLGSSSALTLASPQAGGITPVLSAVTRDPALLVQAVVVFVLSFVFYGAITVACGALAADSAAAQNQARPMFAMLLAAFFVALAAALGINTYGQWLVYAPPFAPFILLLQEWPASVWVASVSLLTAASVGALWLAGRNLTLSPAPIWSRFARARA